MGIKGLVNSSTGVNVDPETRYSFRYPAINTYTSDRQLDLTDVDAYIRMNSSSANIVTIPAHITTPIPVNTMIPVTQVGTGATTIKAATGVTINGILAGSGIVTGQYAGVMLIQVAIDVWDVVGSIGTIA